jgi:DNA polymerase-1
MRYLVLDLEVDTSETFKRSLNQLDIYNEEHKIITIQTKEAGKAADVMYSREGIPRDINLDLMSTDIIVGHNLKFDLLWLWNNTSVRSFLSRGGKVWDTFLAEYILEGHKRQPYKLDYLSKRYGANLKNTEVSDWFSDGKKASDMDPDLLIEYAKEDVINTEIIYLKQIERAKKQGMYNLLRLWMNHVLYICEAEFNGLNIDKENLYASKKHQEHVYNTCINELMGKVKPYWTDEIEFQYKSTDHVSVLLFGGALPIIRDVENPSATGELYYKSGDKKGQIRTKKQKVLISIKGLSIKPEEEWKAKKEGMYKADTRVIEELLLREQNSRIKDVLHLLISHRKEKKLLDYYDLFIQCIHEHSGCIHSSFNLCPVYSNGNDIVPPRTGRISSRSPNVQNLHPKSLPLFTSRLENGVIWEIDYSQLEVRVAAALSDDDVLIWEVNSGVDLHRENAALCLNKDPELVTKEERKLAKAFTFLLLYGGGAFQMSTVHKVPIELAKEFINAFYDKYTGIKEWHKSLISEVHSNARIIDGKGHSYLKSIMNRIYSFEDEEAPQFLKDKGQLRSFRPTDIKNYPVQGTAATIVAIAAGLLFRELYSKNDIYIVNEIHDAILLDCTLQSQKLYYNTVIDVMTNRTTAVIEKYLGFKFPVKLEVDSKFGSSWKECKE